MTCTISNGSDTFEISKETLSRFTQFEVSYKRLDKKYTSSTGTKIIYGSRNKITVIKFVIECNNYNRVALENLLTSGYEFTLQGDFLTSGIDVTKTFYLSGDISIKRIYNSDGGLNTISGTFEEV